MDFKTRFPRGYKAIEIAVIDGNTEIKEMFDIGEAKEMIEKLEDVISDLKRITDA